MLKQAALEGFPAQSSLEPYKEKLNWFIALPKADLSLVFLPNFLAYWILPHGKALSFQAFFYYALLIGSVAWYLRNLGVNLALAIGAGVTLAFSQLYQVWWTSNFPALAASFLPFAILTSSIRPAVRYLLLFWAIGHMLCGQMYPPTYFAVAVAMVPLTLAARPDLMNFRTLGYAGLAAVAALAFYWIWQQDFINAVSGTSYPGHRLSTGGGSSLAALAAAILPTLPVTPVEGGDSTYELSMAGTLFPLMLLPILPHIKWDREAIRLTVVAAVSLLVLAFYATEGFPLSVAKWTGFFVMPGRRAHPGISLIVMVYAVLMISRNWQQWKFLPIAMTLCVYAAVSAYLGVRPGVTKEFWGIRAYAYLPLFFLILAWSAWRIKGRAVNLGYVAGYVVLGGMAVVHVLVFGSFNPIMRGSDIMSPVKSQFMTDWKALYDKNGGQPFAVKGNYGHLLRGEGLSAFEAIHLVNVGPGVYHRLFPDLSETEIDQYFNRFVGIAFDNIDHAESRGATVALALKPKAVPFTHQIILGQGEGSNLLETVPKTEVGESPAGGLVVRWTGKLSTPLPITRQLVLALPCEVESSWLTRYPTSAPTAAAADGVALRGLSGEIRILTGNAIEVRQCVESIAIH